KLKNFITRGKSVRSGLFLLMCNALQPQADARKQRDLLHIAAALEILHTGLLIHDDIIDRDELRRGQASIWKQYQTEATMEKSTDNNYGQSLALCLGSITLYLA